MMIKFLLIVAVCSFLSIHVRGQSALFDVVETRRSTGCNNNIEKLIANSGPAVPIHEVLNRVCGKVEADIMLYSNNATQISRASCRCDIKAQAFLPNADRVEHNINCDCDSGSGEYYPVKYQSEPVKVPEPVEVPEPVKAPEPVKVPEPAPTPKPWAQQTPSRFNQNFGTMGSNWGKQPMMMGRYQKKSW